MLESELNHVRSGTSMSMAWRLLLLLCVVNHVAAEVADCRSVFSFPRAERVAHKGKASASERARFVHDAARRKKYRMRVSCPNGA